MQKNQTKYSQGCKVKIFKIKLFVSGLIFLLLAVTVLTYSGALKNVLATSFFIFLNLLLMTWMFFNYKVVLKELNYGVALQLFFLMVIALSFLASPIEMGLNRETILLIAHSTLPVLVYLSVFATYEERSREIIAFVSLVVCCIALYLSVIHSFERLDLKGELRQVNWGNVALSALPLGLLSKRMFLRILTIAVVSAAVIVSIKRSGYVIILIILSLFFILTFLFSILKKKKLTLILLVLFPLAVTPLLYNVAQFGYIYTAIERLQSISEDGGSGRTEIWSTALRFWELSSPENKLIGYSFSAFEQLSGAAASGAHNDFFDVLLNFGVMGVLVFSLIIIRYLSIGLKELLKYKHSYFGFFLAYVPVLLVYTNVAGIYNFNQLFLFVFACMAIVDKSVAQSK